MEVGAPAEQGDRLLAGIDEIPVFGARSGCRPHAQDAVLALQDDFAIDGQMVGHQRGQPDTEVDVGAFRYVAGNPRGDRITGAFFVGHVGCCEKGVA